MLKLSAALVAAFLLSGCAASTTATQAGSYATKFLLGGLGAVLPETPIAHNTAELIANRERQLEREQRWLSETLCNMPAAVLTEYATERGLEPESLCPKETN